MIETCISLDNRDAWRSALYGVPHAYGHTWESCQAMARTTGYRTFLYVFEDGVDRAVCTFAERPFGVYTDVVTPYGFSGFVSRGHCCDAARRWREFATGRGYVCGYIGLNPFLYDPTLCEPDELFEYNCVYGIDLRMELEELVARMAKVRRRQVRNAERMNCYVFDRKRLTEFLLEHYRTFYRDRGASAVYDFKPETLVAIAECADSYLVGTESDGTVNAVMLFAYTRYIGEYFLNVSVAEGQRNSVALLWQGMKELKSRGVAWLNLGGGIRPGDGVAEFKERFGGTVLPLRSLKQVYNRARYEALCVGASVDPADRAGYFPPYRRPVRVDERVAVSS